MKIAIMQPTYLPWIGYFALIDSVDKFVIYDNVQFVFRSWQRSNKIKSRQGEKKISVTVVKDKSRETLIKDVEMQEESLWMNSHLNLFREYYRKAPYYDEVLELFNESVKNHGNKLALLNYNLIRNICSYLGLCDKSRFIHASELPVSGKKSRLLLDIIHHLKADRYLSPVGSFNYIEEEGLFEQSIIDLTYQNFHHPSYHQLHGDFISHLSIIDLLFNHGKSSLEIIRSGIKTELSPKQLSNLMK